MAVHFIAARLQGDISTAAAPYSVGFSPIINQKKLVCQGGAALQLTL